MTGAPLDYWCYALAFMVETRRVIAKRSPAWRTPKEVHTGNTPELGRYRSLFWQPIWYYRKSVPFPKPKMQKGSFLGFAKDVTDTFCYLIVTIPDDPKQQSKVLV